MQLSYIWKPWIFGSDRANDQPSDRPTSISSDPMNDRLLCRTIHPPTDWPTDQIRWLVVVLGLGLGWSAMRSGRRSSREKGPPLPRSLNNSWESCLIICPKRKAFASFSSENLNRILNKRYMFLLSQNFCVGKCDRHVTCLKHFDWFL